MSASKFVLAAILGLGPRLSARAEAAAVSTPPGIASEQEDFPSSYLKGHIRICGDTPWPEPTETSMMPLLAANASAFKGTTVLDIGTGSGILALYAAQLGAAKVVATDIDPDAIACIRENARRLGLDGAIEARLVSLKDPLAFSVIRPDEVFDIIVSNPPTQVGDMESSSLPHIDDKILRNDKIKLALSIIGGLRQHLNRDGIVVLHYGSEVLHTIVVKYARYLGYTVRHHPALGIVKSDWCALFNTFSVRVARAEGIDSGALQIPLSRASYCGDENANLKYRMVDWRMEHVSFPNLWGPDIGLVLPGMIVIQKDSGS